MNNRYFHTIDELIDGLIDEVIKYVPDGIQYQELNVETPGGMEQESTQLI